MHKIWAVIRRDSLRRARTRHCRHRHHPGPIMMGTLSCSRVLLQRNTASSTSRIDTAQAGFSA